MTDLTRENFMKTTGIFVSHNYFEFVYNQFKDSKLNIINFCTSWKKENEIWICESSDISSFKYMYDDMMLLNNIGDKENLNDSLSTQDIINNLCEECHYTVKKLNKIYATNKKLSDQTKHLTMSVKEIKNQILMATTAQATLILQ